MKNKTAFVTGANGFVGSHLVKLLADQGIDTTAFILKGTDCKLLEILHPSLMNVKILEGDILDKESLADHIKGMHFVFHLAGVLQGYTQEDYDRLNVQGTQNILEACLDVNPEMKRLVISSSTAAAGSGTDENPLKEDDEAKPLDRDYYGISKYKMECLTSTFEDDLPISIVRPSSVLGPGNKVNLSFYKALKLGIKLKVLGPYRPLSFIDVRDLVDGIYQCAINPKAIGEIFYFANDESLSYNDLQDLVSQTVFNRKPGRLISIPIPNFLFRFFGRFSELSNKIRKRPAPFINQSKIIAFLAPGQVVSSEKAKKLLGWQPIHELVSTIAEEGEWYMAQGLI